MRRLSKFGNSISDSIVFVFHSVFAWLNVMELCIDLLLRAFDLQFELPKFSFLQAKVLGFSFCVLGSNSIF